MLSFTCMKNSVGVFLDPDTNGEILHTGNFLHLWDVQHIVVFVLDDYLGTVFRHST